MAGACASTSPSAPSGIPTSCAVWPSAPPTCCSSRRTSCESNSVSRLDLPLPNKGVKHPGRLKPKAFIKRDGPIVGFGHRQRDEPESAPAKVPGRGGHHHFAQPGRTVFREHAHLRNVANIGTHLRAENQSDQRPRAAFDYDERRLRVKR